MKSLPLPPAIELHRGGPRFWRSLEEWSHSPEFLPYLHREFPEHASEWREGEAGFSRRRFLQLMGASLALAGLSACTRQAQETIVPYVKRPEEIIPGQPIFYATTFPHRGYGKGVIVRTEMGRPTHIEGNPDHPASLGATDVFMQASVLGLYDPDRSQLVRRGQDIATREDFTQFALARAAAHDADQGAGLFLLTGRITSPSLSDQIERMQKRFPRMSWCAYEPSEPGWGEHRAEPSPKWNLSQPESGRPNVQPIPGEWTEPKPIYDLAKADVVVSIGADFLGTGPANLIYTKAFSARRRDPTGNFNRLYVVESVPTITGAKADVRWARRPTELLAFSRELVRAVAHSDSASDTSFSADVRQLAAELNAHRGRCAVLAGDNQPQLVHDLVAWLNADLSAGDGPTSLLNTLEPLIRRLGLNDFTQALQSGAAQTLLIAGVNPIYELAPELKFAEALARVPRSVHLGLYDDETGSRCAWHLPESHYLEAWGDICAIDGTRSLIQPMIQPLYPDTMSLPEVISLFIDSPARGGYDIVHDFWKPRLSPVVYPEGFGRVSNPDPMEWERSLNKGIVSGTTPSPSPVTATALTDKWGNPPEPQDGELELIIQADSAVDDGRYANNSWLQELPRPLSKLTWDNVAMLSPKTAKEQGLQIGDVVELTANGQTVEAPVWIQPGHADGCVSVTLGYGRRNVGTVADGVGFNAYRLRTMGRYALVTFATLKSVGRTHPLASTQQHFTMLGRDLVRVQTAQDYEADPHRTVEDDPPPDPKDDLYPPFPYTGYAWAMSIDLSTCVGCNACIVACQSENNIPTVGKEQVLRGREMHWLRVDRYFEGPPEDPAMHFQPVPCMQCEQAPCEVVCPVGATVHSSEGLNDMVYNRCVGTRYCSNNCPYKVRRFNFLKFDDETHPTLALQKNPDVTIRTRGVMEKCTYCVQRIEEARIDAEKDLRRIRDGEIITACQSACPADAIVFGDKNDPKSRVSKLKAQPRDYGLLAELNTRPRTTYLAKITNPPTT